MKKPRPNLLLIGSIYAVALIVLLLAVAALTSILPLGTKPAASAVAQADPTVVVKAVPALRPIWPAGSVAPGASRTRTPTASLTPTQVPATSTWTPAPEQVALAPEATVETALPAGPSASPAAGQAAAGKPSPAPGMPTVVPSPQASPTPIAGQPTASPIPGAPTLGPEFAPTSVPDSGQTGPSATPQPSATPSATRPIATATSTATATEPAGRGRIVGKILVEGQAPTSVLTLTLETQAYDVITHTSVMLGTGGAYTFTQVLDSTEGYNLVFAQEKNPGVQIDEVATWVWIGPVPIEGEAVVKMPDFDIGLRGMKPVNPALDVAYDPPNPSPFTFTWLLYPGNDVKYWMDLYQGKEQQLVWQSPLLTKPEYPWDGKINNQRVADEYWWGVGARSTLDSYVQVAYTYLTRFFIKP